jgi:hypothetical protein
MSEGQWRHVLLSVDKIKAGDIFGPDDKDVWVALADAKPDKDGVEVPVRYCLDGGRDVRVFDVGHEIEIRRRG